MRGIGFVAVLLAVSGTAFGLGWYLAGRTPSSTTGSKPTSSNGTSPVDSPVTLNKVVAQGWLAPQGGPCNVIIPPGQRIERLLVGVGDSVVKGQTLLAQLAGDPLLDKQIELAESRTADTRRELELQVLQAENQYRAAQAALETARLQLIQAQQQQDFSVEEQRISQAEAKLRRLEGLLSDETTARLVSAFEVADQRLELEGAQLQLAQARKIADQSVAMAELAVANAEAQVESAGKNRDAAQDALASMRSAAIAEEIARLQRQSQQVFAPQDGTVVRLFLKPGEAAQTTPLLQIGDLSRMECVAEVVDRLAGQVQVGQSAVITSPALPSPLNGRVTRVESLVGAATLVDPSPLAMVDRRTVEVRIELDEESTELARRWINLQVNVEIAIGSSRPEG